MEKLEGKSFAKGWGQVSVGIAKIVKDELMRVLSIKNDMMWWRRINGRGCRSLSLAEIVAVENIFKKYGINEVWDN